ncbi:YecA family protein [Emticicia soli]|uniref:YecA family protein n=1 Tax=Emticicia soli TaxID=2027878 RepID=A0ABW5JB46_9BACT
MFVFQIIEGDGATLKFKIESGKLKGNVLRSFDIEPCLDLTCTCGNIYFKDEEEQQFVLDTDEHRLVKLVDEETISSEDDEFIAALENEILDSDWSELEEFYKSFKGVASELVEPEEIELEFEDYEDILNGDRMVGYFEVLPWSIDVSIEVDEETYMIVDFYCVLPGCDCTDMVLYLSRDLEQDPELQLFFNYETKEIEIGEINTKALPNTKIIRELTHNQFEHFQGIFANRHQKLTKFFADFLVRNNITPKVKQLPITKEITIGRNDPCSCGSGKKYKKCCGA